MTLVRDHLALNCPQRVYLLVGEKEETSLEMELKKTHYAPGRGLSIITVGEKTIVGDLIGATRGFYWHLSGKKTTGFRRSSR